MGGEYGNAVGYYGGHRDGEVENVGLHRYGKISSLEDYFGEPWNDYVSGIMIYQGFCVLPYKDAGFERHFNSGKPACCDCTHDDITYNRGINWEFAMDISDSHRPSKNPRYCTRNYSDSENDSMSSFKISRCDSYKGKPLI